MLALGLLTRLSLFVQSGTPALVVVSSASREGSLLRETFLEMSMPRGVSPRSLQIQSH